MSDQITINVVPDSFVTVTAEEGNENVYLNPITLNQGIINHSTTHISGGSDELLHNSLGGLNGGTSGQFYHMTQNQYNNNVYRYDLPVYQTGAQNISGIKTFADKTHVSGLKFQVLAGAQVPAYEQGLLFYDDVNHTLNLYVDNSEVTLQLGQENWVRIKNSLNVPILNGDLVYIAGGVGANPYVQLAIASGEITSASTLGMATHDISNNEFGYVTTFGLVNNVDTKDFAVGDSVYLSPTTSGKYTNVKPQAPNHMVRVGTVIRANQNNGVIFVNIQNGFEIDELHNVRIVNKQNKQSLMYNSSSGVWENRLINTGDVSGLYEFVISTESEFLTETEADNRYVNLTSGQNISGLKNFYTRPQVNGTGVLLSGEGGGGAVSGDYLPLSGGTLTGDLYLQEDPENPSNRLLTVEGIIQGNEIYSPNAVYTDSIGINSDSLYFVNTTSGFIEWFGQSRIYNSSNGVIRLTNATNNNFNRLQFGGTTSAFPAIKRNGSGIDIVNSSDTAFSDLRANNTNFNNISGNACTLSGNLLVNTNSLFVNASTDRVGIGTISPTEKLTVLGNISGSGSVIINNDFETIDSTKGVILKSPNGSRFRITIDNSGALTTTAL